MSDTTERPIIFKAQEVKAVLAGGKTQTRVPVLTSEQIAAGYKWGYGIVRNEVIFCKYEDSEFTKENSVIVKCPFGKAGDRLWVQEFHARREYNCRLTKIHYYADGDLTLDTRHDAVLLTKYAAGNMPRWASRLLLEITNIRIERVQDITHNDSVAEYCFNFGEKKKQCIPPLTGFAGYWRKKHGDDAWRSNPWVWVIEFKVIKEGDDD